MTVLELAQKMYAEQANRCVPPWENLMHNGATQSVWIERAQALLAREWA